MKRVRSLDETVAVVLAAGQGTRMKSQGPKVLEPILGKPMLDWVLEVVHAVGIARTILIVGYQGDKVRAHVQKRKGIVCLTQLKQLGTGDAIRCAEREVAKKYRQVLVIYGDTPLFRVETLKRLVEEHESSEAHATFVSALVPDPKGYGRVVRDPGGRVAGIVEEKNLTRDDELNREINTGASLFQREPLFEGLRQLKASPQGEFYLTDLVSSWAQAGLEVQAIKLEDPDEGWGVNTFDDLIRATTILKNRILERHRQAGVEIVDPATTYIAQGVRIGSGTCIWPLTVIESEVTIGEDCSIGPFSRIRSGTRIERGAQIGNFVEINRTRVGSGTKVKHLSYLGDAKVGAHANIGAGTITANFNGREKQKTIIGDEASIGSNTTLVAPVRVGNRATTGAGCVVPKRKNIPRGAVVVGVPARILRNHS